jgi:uncharacterized membrane protein AbrB (regulator of aidB expression)
MALNVVSNVAGGFVGSRQQKSLTERAYDLIILLLLIILVAGALYFLFSFVLTEIVDSITGTLGSIGGGVWAIFKATTPLGAIISIGSGIASWFK